MQIKFAEVSRVADGYIATLAPVEYTTVASDAMTTEIDINSFTDTDVVNALVTPLRNILKVVDDFDIQIHLGDTDASGNFNVQAKLEVTKDGICGGSITSDPDVATKIRHLASDLSMYLFELCDEFAKASKSATPVSKLVAKASTCTTAGGTSPTDIDMDELISEIQKRTKADIVKPKETLADYVCDDTLKEELLEVKDFLEKESEYKSKGISTPKGILLKGVPGTGKTYAARCIAGDVDCYFMVCTASSLQGQYIGSGAQNVKDLFKGAKALREGSGKGVIVFIDELDSFGSRDTHNGGAGGEEDRTLNQLLAELSGFEDSDGILVMGATNYPDRIDDALMRAGRFSRQITIRKPEAAERLHLTEYYFSKIKVPLSGTDYSEISELTKGLTPADIKEIANESAILAIRYSKPDISIDFVNEAVNKVITKNIRTPDGKLDTHLVAAHEAGHVLAEYIYNGNIAIKVTNYSYGGAGGFTQPSDYLEGLFTRERMRNEIKTLVAGRAAEEIIFGSVTNGASNDFEKSKALLKEYYATYHFEPYRVEELKQIIQDALIAIYEEVLEDFKKPENTDTLVKITDELHTRRVLYTKDLAPLLIKGGFII